jgi:hypothetical protein
LLNAAARKGETMTDYRLYMIDDANRIRQAVNIECESDESAARRANEMLSREGFPTIEVWADLRLVRRVELLRPASE